MEHDERDPRSAQMKRWARVLALHAGIFAVLLLVWRCPVWLLFGVPCPGCGITRAYLTLLKGDVAGAFAWNPMFLPAGLAFLYVIHRGLLPLKLGKRAEVILGILILTGMIGVYLYRLITGSGPIQPDPASGLVEKILHSI